VQYKETKNICLSDVEILQNNNAISPLTKLKLAEGIEKGCGD
jgi:hypothetical protein